MIFLVGFVCGAIWGVTAVVVAIRLPRRQTDWFDRVPGGRDDEVA